jgi:hypothetical protein
MPYLLASIPYFRCMVRKEYLRDLQDSHGEYCEATAIGVLSVRADAPHFMVVLHEPLAGCAFTVPIEALCTKPCDPVPTKVAAPWDMFGSEIGICELTAVRRTPVRLVKEAVAGTYLFTIAFTGTDLADDPAQRKLLSIIAREDGIITALPNNRFYFVDRALFGDLTERPDFLTMTKEFRAEGLGNPSVNSPSVHQPAVFNGTYANPKERPDWHHA